MHLTSKPKSRRALCMSVATLRSATFAAAQATDETPKGVDAEDVLNLSPFVVDAETDEGYAATQTLAGGPLNALIFP
jgi:hypothetical protein